MGQRRESIRQHARTMSHLHSNHSGSLSLTGYSEGDGESDGDGDSDNRDSGGLQLGSLDHLGMPGHSMNIFLFGGHRGLAAAVVRIPRAAGHRHPMNQQPLSRIA